MQVEPMDINASTHIENNSEQAILGDGWKDEDWKENLKLNTSDSGINVSIDDREKELIERLEAFLVDEKEFPRESLKRDITKNTYNDLTINHPDTNNPLAVFNVKTTGRNAGSLEPSEILAKTLKTGFAGKYNPFVYMVYPSEESNEDFLITRQSQVLAAVLSAKGMRFSLAISC